MEPVYPADVQVSVIDPINPAIERVKVLLFSPFDLGRWLTIAFCAWLASMVPHGIRADANRGNLESVKSYVLANLSWIVPLGIVAIVVGIGILLLLVWLRCRGQFMFLDCVVRNVAHVRDPWHRFRGHAASLFGFRVVAGLIMVAISLAVGTAGITLAMAARAVGFPPASVIGLVAVGLIFLVMSILFIVVGLFTTDFVVPIMYLHGVSCTQAWRMLLDLLSWNQWRFVLYVLFRALLWIAITIVVTGVGCITCCVGFCLMALPYIGTAVLLPILAFVRSYSAYYLSQYGPQFNVFPPPMPAPPVGQ